MVKPEIYQRLTYLEEISLLLWIFILQHLDWISHLDKRSKFCPVVFNVQFSILHFDIGMHSGNRNIGYLHICIYTSSDSELTCFIDVENVNDFCRGALDTLHDEVIIIRLLKVHDLEQTPLHISLKSCFTELTFKGFPEEALDLIPIVYELLSV